jgi:hypothetical protein
VSSDLSQLTEISKQATTLYNYLFNDPRMSRLALEVCDRMGISKKEIEASRLDDFAEAKLPTSVQHLRFLHTEERRLAKLNRIAEEVKQTGRPVHERAVTGQQDHSITDNAWISSKNPNRSIDSSFSHSDYVQHRMELGQASVRKQIQAQEKVAQLVVESRKTHLDKLRKKEERLRRQLEETQLVHEERKKKQEEALQKKQESWLKRHEEQVAENRRKIQAVRKRIAGRDLKGSSPLSSRSPSIIREVSPIEDDVDYSEVLDSIHERLEAGAYRASVLRSVSLMEKKQKQQQELKNLENLQKVKQMQEKKQALGAIKFKARMDSHMQTRMELMTTQVSKLASLNSKKRQKHDDEVKRQHMERLQKERMLKVKDHKQREVVQKQRALNEEAIRLMQEKESLKASDARENLLKESKLLERQKHLVLLKHSQDAENASKMREEREELARQAKDSWEEVKRLKQAAKEKMQTALEKLN